MKEQNRTKYIDTIKGIGIFLVFYGHFIGNLYYTGYDFTFLQFKLVYSFHMPLFFFISGIFWKPGSKTFSQTFKEKFLTRIVPALFWSIVLIPYWLTEVSPQKLLQMISKYPSGNFTLNGPSWFLICLFVTEAILALFSKYFSSHAKPIHIIGFISGAFLIGFFQTHFASEIQDAIGVGSSFWYYGEVFIAVGFYLTGYLLKGTLLQKPKHAIANLLASAVSLIVLLATFNLNTGAENENFTVILMSIQKHGDYGWFLISAFSGISFLFLLFRALPFEITPIQFVGRNTIIFYALNSFNYYIFDNIIASSGIVPSGFIPLTVFTILYVSLSIVLYIPIAVLLRKYIPVLVGVKKKSKIRTPVMNVIN